MWQPVLVLLLLSHAGTVAGELPLDSNDSVGSPVDLAWEAWLLMDSKSGDAVNEAPRRIHPKSVFIAPAFSPQSLPACPDGYRSDAMGRCVKLVKLNQAAQLDFLLQRLNSMYAAPEAVADNSNDNSGPVKMKLPIASDIVKEEEGKKVQENENDKLVEVSVVMADVAKRSSSNESSENSTEPDPVITMSSVDNNTVPKIEDLSIPVQNKESVPDLKHESEEPTSFKLPLPLLTDVLTPTDVEDSLPMLVISPDSSVEVIAQMHEQNSQEEIVSNVNTSLEFNLEESKSNMRGEELANILQVLNTTNVTNASDVFKSDLPIESKRGYTRVKFSLKAANDEAETDLVDSEVNSFLENVSVKQIPVNEEEHLRDDLTLVATQAAHNSDIATPKSAEDLHIVGRVPQNDFVRFPISDNDDPNRFLLFKGNYIKFRRDDAYRYRNNKPIMQIVPPPSSQEKQTLWWLPPGWRLDRQRHQPTLQRFWSHVPIRLDISHVSQYNSSHRGLPLPYKQPYNPINWASMKGHTMD